MTTLTEECSSLSSSLEVNSTLYLEAPNDRRLSSISITFDIGLGNHTPNVRLPTKFKASFARWLRYTSVYFQRHERLEHARRLRSAAHRAAGGGSRRAVRDPAAHRRGRHG